MLGAESVVGGQRYLASSLRGHVDAVGVGREVHHHAEVVVGPCIVGDGDVRAVGGTVADINGIGAVEADDGSKVGPSGCVCGGQANGDILACLARGCVEVCREVGRLRGERDVRPRGCLGDEIYRGRRQA